MKQFRTTLIFLFFSGIVFGQTKKEMPTHIRLRDIFDAAVKTDNLIKKIGIKEIIGDGDWGSSTDYYKDHIHLKSFTELWQENGTVYIDEYYKLDGDNKLAKITYSDGGKNVEIYLIRLDNKIIEIDISGDASSLPEIIQKTKTDLAKD